MNKKCIVCGRSLSGTETEVHHISYPVKGFPEVTIEIHKRCHEIIHNTDYYPGLKPRKGHSAQYYSQEESTEDIDEDEDVVDQPQAVPSFLEDTRYLECPVCQHKVRKSGQYGHFSKAHPRKDYEKYKDQFTPTTRGEVVETKGISKKKRANYTKILDIIRNQMENFTNEMGSCIGVPLKVIVEEAKREEIGGDFVKKALRRQKKRGQVYEPTEDAFALILH